MPELEVYTTGGGYFVEDMMQYLAAFSSGSMFNDMLTFGITVGVIFACVRILLTGNYQGLGAWVIVVAVMGALSVGPKARVIVMDSTYPLEIYGAVDDVPYSVALFANLTSSTSYHLTRRMETLLSQPNSLTYQRHGMLFGATLMSQAARWRAVTPSVHNNLVSFMENCMIDGGNIGLLDLDDLARDGDLPALIAANAPGSLAYYDEASDNTVRCSDGWVGLENQLNDEVTRVLQTRATARRDATGVSAGTVDVAALTGTLTDFQNMIGMAGYDATRYLKQSMLILALDDAADRLIANSGNSSAMSLYQSARAEQQTRASYQSTGTAALKWVPLVKVTFEVLYYGVFPIALMLMMTPLALTVVKGYFGGFVWLAAWEPMSAILHTAMLKASSGYYREHTTTLSGGSVEDVLSWANHFGVQAVEQDIGNVAGYLMMSIPFLSTVIFFGATRMAGLATSLLNVGQGAAIETGREAATGSISLGNSAMNNFQANKWNTSQVRDFGRSSTTLSDGAVVTTNADGSQTYSAGTAQSNVGLSGTLGSSVRAEVGERLSEAQREVQTRSSDFANSVSETRSQISDFMRSVTESQTAGTGVSTVFSDDQREEYRQAINEVESFARDHNLSTNVALDALIAGNLSGRLGTPSSVASAQFIADLRAQGKIGASDTEAVREAFSSAYDNSSSSAVSSLISASDRAFADSASSRQDGATNSVRDAYDRAQSAAVRLNDAYEQSSSLERTQGLLSSQDSSFNTRLTDAFINRLSQDGYSQDRISNLVNPKTTAGVNAQRDMVDSYLPQMMRDLGFPSELQGDRPTTANLATSPSITRSEPQYAQSVIDELPRPDHGNFGVVNDYTRSFNEANRGSFDRQLEGSDAVRQSAAAQRDAVQEQADQLVGGAWFDRAAGVVGFGDDHMGPLPPTAPQAGMPSSMAIRQGAVPPDASFGGTTQPSPSGQGPAPFRQTVTPASSLRSNGSVDQNGFYRASNITYQLDGQIRDEPVQPAIMARLSGVLNEMSATTGSQYSMLVTSGGQPTHGVEGVDRTGSHRHDNGQSVDFVLMRDGEIVRPSDDREGYAMMINRAAQDFNGIGHYAWGLHIGHGAPAFWGPDTTSATADPYFRDAYNSGRN